MCKDTCKPVGLILYSKHFGNNSSKEDGLNKSPPKSYCHRALEKNKVGRFICTIQKNAQDSLLRKQSNFQDNMNGINLLL